MTCRNLTSLWIGQRLSDLRSRRSLGEGTKGSGPRRRTVLTSPEFSWAVDLLHYWCSEGRDFFATADRSPALWPSERSGRLTLNALGRSFTAFRRRARLPPERSRHARAKTLVHNAFTRRWLRSTVRPGTTRTLLRIHNVAVHIGFIGLQTEGDPADDHATHSNGGFRWLSSGASATDGTSDE